MQQRFKSWKPAADGDSDDDDKLVIDENISADSANGIDIEGNSERAIATSVNIVDDNSKLSRAGILLDWTLKLKGRQYIQIAEFPRAGDVDRNKHLLS